MGYFISAVYKKNIVSRSDDLLYNWISTHAKHSYITEMRDSLQKSLIPKNIVNRKGKPINAQKNYSSEWQRLIRDTRGMK